MDGRALLASFVLAGLGAACSPGDSTHLVPVGDNAAVEETPGLGDVLVSLDTVYVPIDPSSLRSLDEALEKKGYGNVGVSDLKRLFIYEETPVGRAMVAYSTAENMAPNSLYETMPPSDWLHFALSDESSVAVVLDPGRRPVVLEKGDIASVLDRLAR